MLAEVGRSSWHPECDVRPWGELETRVSGKNLSERSLLALFDAAMGLRVRNSTYHSSLADSPDEISEQTASNDLRKMVEAELLLPKGERRGRYYVASQGVASIMREIRAERPTKDRSDPSA